MAYNLLTIRTAEFEDGSLYPVLGDRTFPIELEDIDGEDVEQFEASAIRVHLVGDTLTKVVAVSDVAADVFVTDARVAISCTKWDKGSRWMGANLAVPLLNAASAIRAARRRKGKMLVGHVRYPWITKVGFHFKEGMFGEDTLRILLAEATSGEKRSLVLEIVPSRRRAVSAIAQSICQRTAVYRLNHDPSMNVDEHKRFVDLCEAGPLEPIPKTYSYYVMPTSWSATTKTAYQPAVLPTVTGVGDKL